MQGIDERERENRDKKEKRFNRHSSFVSRTRVQIRVQIKIRSAFKLLPVEIKIGISSGTKYNLRSLPVGF